MWHGKKAHVRKAVPLRTGKNLQRPMFSLAVDPQLAGFSRSFPRCRLHMIRMLATPARLPSAHASHASHFPAFLALLAAHVELLNWLVQVSGFVQHSYQLDSTEPGQRKMAIGACSVRLQKPRNESEKKKSKAYIEDHIPPTLRERGGSPNSIHTIPFIKWENWLPEMESPPIPTRREPS